MNPLTKTWNWPQFTLAMMALLGLVAITIIEQWFGKLADEGSKQIIIGFATLAYAYFFQSSVGSKAKDETIARAMAGSGNGSALAPTGKANDPVSVTVAGEDPGLAAFRKSTLEINRDATDESIKAAYESLKSRPRGAGVDFDLSKR